LQRCIVTVREEKKNVWTKKQAEKLHRAIDLAQDPGACTYVRPDGQGPRCVIAQLAVLEGVSLETLRVWDAASESGGSVAIHKLGETGVEVPAAIDAYSLPELRYRVQERWDSGIGDSSYQRSQIHENVTAFTEP
jgi:hypothetical protein